MPGVPVRHSVRLRGFDYRSVGAYFVTLNALRRACLFGDIVDDKMVLNHIGQIVETCWRAIPDHFARVLLDAFVIMPNHIHGILLKKGARRGTACRAPTERFGRPVPGSIPTVVRSFKSAATRETNREKGSSGAPFWQRGYYEHVVRDDEELNRIRRYIEENPLRWALDQENTARPV